MSQKVLITDYVHPKLITTLEANGYEVSYERNIDMDILPKIIPEYDGIIINSKIKMHKSMIDLASNLKFIGRLGSGMEIIDQSYAKSKGIHVFNTPKGNCNAVGEHAMAMLLSLANNIIQGNREVKNFQWNREKNRGFELAGKTIGIVGFGHTGRAFAEKLQGWNVNVLAHDKYIDNFPDKYNFVSHVDKYTICEKSDIISFHLPLTDETYYYVNESYLSKCKSNVIIINTSRGKVIETSSLIKGMQDGNVVGACLDVFENEKPHTYSADEKDMYNQLMQRDNVIVTPHVAGWTHESLEKISDIILAQLNISI